MKTKKNIKNIKNIFDEYPEKHKRLLFPDDCKICDMVHTLFCKEMCINALIEHDELIDKS